MGRKHCGLEAGGTLGLVFPRTRLTAIDELGHAANRIFGAGSSDIKEDKDKQLTTITLNW